MKTIQSMYNINSRTLAILPAKQIEYDSIVLEDNKTKHVRKTPLNLIKRACFNNWTTYEHK